MPPPRRSSRAEESVGALLQFWRSARHLSQLALAHEAEISPRHLCFVETGRSKPSRDMVLRLADVLDVPLRSRNALLLAAGFAPVFAESDLNAPELAAVRGALDAILKQQEPFPAVVLNRSWDIIGTNTAADRFFGFLMEGQRPIAPPNVLRLMFHPEALRPFVANWLEVAETLYRRAHREAVGGVPDASLKHVLADIMSYPDVPQTWRSSDPSSSLLPIVPVTFRRAGRTFNFFSTVTTLGTPQDVTVQEIRIECFFPVDDATRREARALAGQAAAAIGAAMAD
jgi:transcriptional regulator with XRE-family HTH domain